MSFFNKTIFVSHRVNSIEELLATDTTHGIELDIRDSPDGKLRIVHDPYLDGDDLEKYLDYYKHKLIIFNVKSERIEYKILELINKINISNYFFLDSSVPMIHKLISYHDTINNDNNKNTNTKNTVNKVNIAVRFSEYEPIEFVMKFSNKVNWVWVDCFNNFPLNPENYKVLKNGGFKICIVSPELQDQPEKIKIYAKYIIDNNLIPDAICCKYYNIDVWKNIS